MSETHRRYESMLFNYETTVNQEFRNGAIHDIKRTVYKEKPTCLRVRPPPLKDIQTMTEWKTPYLPIDMLVKPKDVVRTNPKETQKPFAPFEDTEKDRIRKARPRLVMTPAVSMDDIEDDYQREILTKEMYTSSAKSAMELGIASQYAEWSNVKSPLQGTLALANPITIRRLQFPYIAPEWRMSGVSWDTRQLRGYCDPSKEFYLSRTPRCKFCDETAAREKNRKMLNKMKRNKT